MDILIATDYLCLGLLTVQFFTVCVCVFWFSFDHAFLATAVGTQHKPVGNVRQLCGGVVDPPQGLLHPTLSLNEKQSPL